MLISFLLKVSGIQRSLRVFKIMENRMTEFEENVSFDIDDPDFAPTYPPTIPHNVLHSVQFTDITFGVNKCEYIRLWF